MKQTDARALFSSVWDDDEVIIFYWSREIVEGFIGRPLTTEEWNGEVSKWEGSFEADQASEVVGDAIIDSFDA